MTMRKERRTDRIRPAAVLLAAILFAASAPVIASAAPQEEGAMDEYWYYLDKEGVCFNLDGKDSGTDDENFVYQGRAIKRTEDDWPDLDEGEDGENILEEVAAKVINKNTYLFDRDGKMLTGLYRLYDVRTAGGQTLGSSAKTDEAGGVYYFSEQEGETLGAMQKDGAKIIELGEGNKYYYRFRADGRAYTDTMYGNRLYGHDGSRVEADKGRKIVTVGNEEDNLGDRVTRSGAGTVFETGTMLVVSSTGSVLKGGERVKVDDQYYRVKKYVATLIDDDDET